LEIILIDDFSHDNSSYVIQRLQENDDRIKIIKNQKNMGSLYSRSVGIIMAKGEYIFALDNDDLFISQDIFYYILNIAEGYNCDIVGFSAFKIGNYGDSIEKMIDLIKEEVENGISGDVTHKVINKIENESEGDNDDLNISESQLKNADFSNCLLLTAISNACFYLSSIEYVTLPEGGALTVFQAGAFSSSKLKRIKIPDTLTKICGHSVTYGGGPFTHCYSLTAIEISKTSNLKTIEFAIAQNVAVNSIFVPKERNALSYSQEGREHISMVGYGTASAYRNNWNEKNRAQGIVNLSVIDDKKDQGWNLDLGNENEINDRRVDDNEEDSKHDNNNQSREIREIHSNYDSDENREIDPRREYNRINDNNNNNYNRSSQNQLNISGRNRQGTSSLTYQIEGRDNNVIRPNISSNYMINRDSERDGNRYRNVPGFQTTSVNYNISNDNRREDPKIVVNNRSQYVPQSQNRDASNLMKKKKVKKFEYLRDPNQRQNFQ